MRKRLLSGLMIGVMAMTIMSQTGETNTVMAEENVKFEANTESLSEYEVPEWYRDAKFGIFIHYGIYSVPAFGDEWYGHWMYMQGTKSYGGSDIYSHHLNTYGAASEVGYKDFIPEFATKLKAFSDNNKAEEWAALFEKAGAKYVVPVGMHHDSFALYDSDVQTTYNSVTQAGVDYIAQLQQAVKAKGMKFGISNHFAENDWFFDEAYGKDTDMADPAYSELYGTGGSKTKSHIEKWYAIQSEITEKYKPDLIYFDFDLVNDAFNRYEGATRYQMLADYYNMAAENNMEVVCNFKNGAFTNSEAVLNKEREALGYINPAVWQTDTSVGRKSWCYTTDDVYRPASEIISGLVDIVSKNGNLLLNVGPQADGTIPDDIVKTLTDVGAWLDVYGDAIYASRPWLVYGEGTTVNSGDTYSYTSSDIRFTKSKDNSKLYATALAAPKTEKMVIKTLKKGEWDAERVSEIALLNGSERIPCEYEQTENGLEIIIKDYNNIKTAYSVEMTFKDDVIPTIAVDVTGTIQTGNTYESKSVEIENCTFDGSYMIKNTEDNAYAKYLLNTNGKNLSKIVMTVSGNTEGTIEIHKGSADGEKLGEADIEKAADGQYRTINANLTLGKLEDKLDLCIVLNGNIELSDFKLMEKRGLDTVIEAEDFDEKNGTVQPEPTKDSAGGNENIGYVTPGDWVKYSGVDFGDGCNKLLMRLAGSGQSCVVRLDDVNGEIIARSGPVNTGSWEIYNTFEYDIENITGVHDVYIVFDSACNVNWFKFTNDNSKVGEDSETEVVKEQETTVDKNADGNKADNSTKPMIYVLVGMVVGSAATLGIMAVMKKLGKKKK